MLATHHLPMYVYIVVTTKEFSENKVLNIVNVELWQLKLHLLPHVVKHSVSTCGSKCKFNYVYIYIYAVSMCLSVCLSVRQSQLFCSNIPPSLSWELTNKSSYIRRRSRLYSQRHIMVNGHLKFHFIFIRYMKKINSALTILIIQRLCPFS